MQLADVSQLRKSMDLAQQIAHEPSFDSCDASDLDEVIEAVKHELQRPLPNQATLTTYLNSLLRSLRANPSAREAYVLLDEALRNAGFGSPQTPGSG